MRVLAWCVLPNHWHFVLWPRGDGDLSEFMRWLTVTHTQRWHAAHRTAGTGPLYQGRFKSFPIQEDDHFLTVLRYVERNPLRANLVERPTPGGGRVFGIASTATSPDCSTMVRWRCREVGGNTCNRRRPKRNWRRCGGRWCAARRLARRRGRNERRSDWAESTLRARGRPWKWLILPFKPPRCPQLRCGPKNGPVPARPMNGGAGGSSAITQGDVADHSRANFLPSSRIPGRNQRKGL